MTPRCCRRLSLDRMHADRIGPTYGADAGPGTGYGMGWWVDRASGRISDPGVYGSVPWLDLEDGYGAYLVIEADSNTAVELAQQLFDVIEQAVTRQLSDSRTPGRAHLAILRLRAFGDPDHQASTTMLSTAGIAARCGVGSL